MGIEGWGWGLERLSGPISVGVGVGPARAAAASAPDSGPSQPAQNRELRGAGRAARVPPHLLHAAVLGDQLQRAAGANARDLGRIIAATQDAQVDELVGCEAQLLQRLCAVGGPGRQGEASEICGAGRSRQLGGCFAWLLSQGSRGSSLILAFTGRANPPLPTQRQPAPATTPGGWRGTDALHSKAAVGCRARSRGPTLCRGPSRQPPDQRCTHQLVIKLHGGLLLRGRGHQVADEPGRPKCQRVHVLC